MWTLSIDILYYYAICTYQVFIKMCLYALFVLYGQVEF